MIALALCFAFFSVALNVSASDYVTNLDFGASSSYSADATLGVEYSYKVKVAMEYTPANSQWICNAKTSLARTATFTGGDGLYILVYGSGAKPQDGTLMATSDVVLASDMTSTLKDYTFNFPNCFSIIGGHQYYFVLKRTGTTATYPGTNNKYIYIRKDSSVLTTTNYWWYDQFDWTEISDYELYLNLYGYEGLDIETNITPVASSSWFSLTGSDEMCQDLYSSKSYFNIAYNLCYAGGFMFIPDPSVMENNVQVREAFMNTFPFSWFGEIKDGFWNATDQSNVASTTYATLTLVNLDLDYKGASQTYNVSLLNTASASEYVGASSISTIRNLLLYVIYFGWSFAVYKIIMKAI